MEKYSCLDCGMEVTNLTCGCGPMLEHKVLTKPDGSTVGVSECPKRCGKIKSPACCGHDMVANH